MGLKKHCDMTYLYSLANRKSNKIINARAFQSQISHFLRPQFLQRRRPGPGRPLRQWTDRSGRSAMVIGRPWAADRPAEDSARPRLTRHYHVLPYLASRGRSDSPGGPQLGPGGRGQAGDRQLSEERPASARTVGFGNGGLMGSAIKLTNRRLPTEKF